MSVTIVLIWLALLLSSRGIISEVHAINLNDWELVFSDEFNGPILDKNKWGTTYMWGVRTLSGNNELEWYVDDAHEFENGILKLVARRESVEPGFPYTSGMISGHVNFSQQYGYFEIRCKMPNHNGGAPGLWPAFWLLPATGEWPPEIDIHEWLSPQPTNLHMAIHWGTEETHEYDHTFWSGPDFSQDFHTYGLEWAADECIWYIDGVERRRFTDSSRIPHQPMYPIANLAVGGWPGTPDDSTPFPAYYEVDYIRVYKKPETSPTGSLPSPTPADCNGPGDVDCNGEINAVDALAVLRNWFSSSPNPSRADANGDGKVNGVDFGYVIRDWSL